MSSTEHIYITDLGDYPTIPGDQVMVQLNGLDDGTVYLTIRVETLPGHGEHIEKTFFASKSTMRCLLHRITDLLDSPELIQMEDEA